MLTTMALVSRLTKFLLYQKAIYMRRVLFVCHICRTLLASLMWFSIFSYYGKIIVVVAQDIFSVVL